MSPNSTPPRKNAPAAKPVGFPWMSPISSSTSTKWPSSPQPSSPSRHSRTALYNAFPGLSISDSKSSSQSSNSKSFKSSIRSRRFPNWTSISRATGPRPREVQFTIKMNNGYRVYSNSDPYNLATDLFNDLSNDILEIRNKADDPKMSDVMSEEITSAMMELVFSSNLIERAGLGYGITIKICQKIFEGGHVDARDFDERSPEYTRWLQDLAARNNPTNKAHIIRSRQEIIQHALALQYIMQKVAFESLPLSEAIICDTHKILTKGIDAMNGPDVISSTSYGGVYRTVPVMAGATCFVTPAKVPGCMRDFISDYNEDVRRYENEGLMDPFWIAAKLCDKFVNIHPFLDGNGRMCRLVLNAILLKYTGMIVSIGEYDGERKEYCDIAVRASAMMEGPGELAVLVLKKATQRFKSLKQSDSA
ncbi:fido domain-containing protein [Cadophora sp. MPI-SDFR-AT-0126]|nr:fido domain-containing protein [Leotiomycetes sp. MPI-SDFR-AT-0126]